MASTPARDSERKESLRRNFAALTGLFLGLALLKFGNPAILDHLVVTPASYLEFVFQPWPLVWGYAVLAVLALFGGFAARWRLPEPRWLTLLPLAWFGWVCASAAGTIDGRLTNATLPYLGSCALGFYLGLLALAPSSQLRMFWLVLLACFAAMLAVGFQQHFGGLEDVRQHVRSTPGWQQLPAEYLRRLESNRIWATLFYPNTLAGVLLLLLPVLAVMVWRLGEAWSPAVRASCTSALLLAGLACLYWSKSKTGWLIALVLGAFWLFRLPVSPRVKRGLAGVGLALGIAAFGIRFSGYFGAGATSLEARKDYWAAAWTTACANPVLGTGPGTFAANYRRLKPADAEMAQLTHNDYLQQACDSGFPAALMYLGFIGGSLVWLRRTCSGDMTRFAVWTGLLGWACQSWMEFGLYVPALGWSAFWLLGWLWGSEGTSDAAKAWTFKG